MPTLGVGTYLKKKKTEKFEMGWEGPKGRGWGKRDKFKLFCLVTKT